MRYNDTFISNLSFVCRRQRVNGPTTFSFVVDSLPSDFPCARFPLIFFVVDDSLCGRFPLWSLSFVVDFLCGRFPLWSIPSVVDFDSLRGRFPLRSTPFAAEFFYVVECFLTGPWVGIAF